ncbi:MAG: AsmA family protein [Niveispirillum sp.]|uniref:AsmA family protein n=1 Tax=Niveispirillum sp. TaxID=1917217 RepID=UPI00403529AF
MKRIAVTLGLTLALLILVVLVGPSLVPWNEFRARAADVLAELTGRQVVIDGDLNLTLLPVPTLTAADVRLLDNGEPLARVGRVAMQVRPWPLLQGQVHIQHLALNEAEMRAILPADGPARWPIALSSLGGAVQVEGVSLSAGSLALERAGGDVIRLAGLAGELAAGGPSGPFEVTATGSLDGAPARFSLNAARKSANGAVPVRAILALTDAKAELRFTGNLPPAGGNLRLEGDVALQGPDAAPVLRLVQHLAGMELPADAMGGTGDGAGKAPALSLRGRLSLSRQNAGMDGIELQWGDSRATGSVEIPRSGDGVGAVVLAFTALDLDGLGRDLPGLSPWLLRANLTLDLLADQGRWRGDILRDLRLVGRLGGGVLGDAELSATLPGSTALTLKGAADFSGEQPVLGADLDLKSDSVRDTLAWAGVGMETVPLERLRQARLTGRLSGKPQDMALTDAKGSVDTTGFSGAVTLSRRDRTGLGLRLDLDRLDLDAYRTKEAPPLWPVLKPLLADIDLTLEGKAAQLVVAGLPIEGLVLDAGWTGGALTLRDGAADGVAGIKVKASGHLSDKEGEASHLTLTGSGTTLAPLLRALGRPDPVLAERLGPVAVEARLVGDAAKLSVDIRADALGGTTQLGGSIGNPTARQDAQLDVKLRSTLPDSANLLRLLMPDWRPAGALGPLDLYAGITGPLSGTLVLDGVTGQFAGHNVNGALTWVPAPADGSAAARLDGKLSLSVLDADLVIPALTRDGDSRELGWDLGWTRRLNGKLDVSVPQLTLGGEKLGNVSLPLIIGNGLIRVEGAAGRWQGGDVTLTGALEQTERSGLATDEEPGPVPLSGSVNLAIKDAVTPGWLAGPSLGIGGGRFDLSLTGTGAGPTPRALLSALAGEGQASLRDGSITGLDLALVGKKLSEGGPKGPTQLRTALRAKGVTGFDSLSLSFTLADKVAALSGIEAAGPAGRITGAGRWSWAKRTLDLGLTVTPASPADAPPMAINLTGPDQSSVRTLDVAAADAWLGKREAERLTKQAAAAEAAEAAKAKAAEAAKPKPPAPAAPKPQPAPPQKPAAKPEKEGTVQGILDRLKGNP